MRRIRGLCRRAMGAHVQERSSSDDRGAVRVLVVDDDKDVRDVICTALEREHFELRQAGDGRSAVDLAHTFQPDVILLDLNLPQLSGLDVCQRVRQFSDAYILMLTASDDLSDKLVGLSAGADDYVTKPCSMPEVIARIRALMRRTRGASTTDQGACVRRAAGRSIESRGVRRRPVGDAHAYRVRPAGRAFDGSEDGRVEGQAPRARVGAQLGRRRPHRRRPHVQPAPQDRVRRSSEPSEGWATV